MKTTVNLLIKRDLSWFLYQFNALAHRGIMTNDGKAAEYPNSQAAKQNMFKDCFNQISIILRVTFRGCYLWGRRYE
jgi:hypothetical protein